MMAAPYVGKKSRPVALIVCAYIVVVLAVTAVGWLLVGRVALTASLMLVGAIVVFLVLDTHRRLEASLRQTESLMSLFFTIKPDLPLPITRGAAASPDFLKFLAEIVLRSRPKTVVEASSGISTLVIAYCLKRLGQGHVFSLEDDANYAGITRELIEFHGLQQFATIIHAPMRTVDLGDDTWLWYDMAQLSIESEIDLFVVDGPRWTLQHLARYPAMPLIYKQLADGATVMLDDGRRRDERRIVERWKKEFPKLVCTYLPLEKGAFIIDKPDQSEAHPGT